MGSSLWTPLPREEVIKAVERGRPSRIPLVRAHWWAEGLQERYGDRLAALQKYPEDAEMLWVEPLDVDAMGLSWERTSTGGLDSRCVIDDWGKLDEFIEKLPDAENDPQFEALAHAANQIHAQGRYLMFGWWFLFFERPWSLRGMENLLVDYYENPEHVHRLHSALFDVYARYIRRSARELRPDAFWTSDDLGHQTQPMMLPKTFRAYIKPYYTRLGEVMRELRLHWWFHSCGNITPLVGDLVDAGVTVLHPIQKGTMDEVAVAREFGGKLSFLAGMDVQHTLQEKDPGGVREEVRFLIETFDRSDGGMCLGAGNSIVPGTPYENIEAFLDEALLYGAEHRRRYL